MEMEKPDPFRMVEDIRKFARLQLRKYAIGPVGMDRVPGSQASQAADLLAAWFTAKKSQRIDRLGAKQILTNLGFNPDEIDIVKTAQRTWVNWVGEVIRDRNRCPIPFYGS